MSTGSNPSFKVLHLTANDVKGVDECDPVNPRVLGQEPRSRPTITTVAEMI